MDLDSEGDESVDQYLEYCMQPLSNYLIWWESITWTLNYFLTSRYYSSQQRIIFPSNGGTSSEEMDTGEMDDENF